MNLLAYVYPEMVHADFMHSLLEVQESLPDVVELLGVPCPSGAIDLARQTAADYCLEGGYDRLIFVDTDQVFRSNHVINLLNHNVDIVGGVIMATDGRPCVFGLDGERWFVNEENPKRLAEVGAIGMGFTAIKREVLVEEDCVFRISYDPYTSEDRNFCLGARMNHFKIYADPGLRIGHIKSHVI
jgi:hypothetical protein